ncbi:alpha/beta hydrolase [Marinobacter pelagius]|uniref:alpha/beta hydrolase n=1 Tax=Marinobacter sp. C7 TaxID=2951363 RepID=UPI001EF04BA1|nr:alpha/beta hydrolase [Marinobacter sp. C7]MCG7198964.1 alpha/beta hydrolase [Marinobacter sp. C7]
MLQPLLEAGLRQTMNRLVRPVLAPGVPVTVQRALIRQAYRSSLPPRGCRFSRGTLGGVPVVRTSCGKQQDGVILYLHGGGFVIGSADTHRGICGHLAKASRCLVVAPDYRLAPEHPFPAALDDAEATYLQLLAEGYEPGQIAFAGDSAGGGLCVSLAMRLRDQKHRLPSSLTLLSPWTDLTQEQLYRPESEPVLQPAWTAKAARFYAGNESLSNPLISPVFGDLRGLPPTLIQVGSDEILLNDAERLAHAASRDQVPVDLEIYNSLWHVFQVHSGQLRRATEAVRTAGEHIREHLQD